jgi:hypothetical protein
MLVGLVSSAGATVHESGCRREGGIYKLDTNTRSIVSKDKQDVYDVTHEKN